MKTYKEMTIKEKKEKLEEFKRTLKLGITWGGIASFFFLIELLSEKHNDGTLMMFFSFFSCFLFSLFFFHFFDKVFFIEEEVSPQELFEAITFCKTTAKPALLIMVAVVLLFIFNVFSKEVLFIPFILSLTSFLYLFWSSEKSEKALHNPIDKIEEKTNV